MFEYDPVKSNSNLDKHGIDFKQAEVLWKDPERLVITARSNDESRFLLIAKLQGVLWSAVYTVRGNNIRIISVRKSRNNERKIYKSS